MKTYLYESLEPEDFRVIPQAGVRQARFPPDSPFGACWDGLLAPDGRVYVAAGAEASIGEYVKLCEYDYEANRFIELFYGRDVFLPPARSITSSKFHFSLDVMEDGRIIGASHTTDKAPAHPAWMYKQYYYHLWEGYPGSSLVIYDPRDRSVEHLGIVTPRETIYGGVYSPGDRSYYGIGFIRGHLYRYSLETRRLTDFGKVTEWKTFRLHRGPDGDIYGASRSGFLFKLDVDAGRIVDLDFEISGHIRDPEQRRASRSMAATATIPGTSKFLFTVFSANESYIHDTATGKTEYLGPLYDTDGYCRGLQSRECVYTMRFDRDGVLWYALTCYPITEMNGDLTFRRAASLMRWDILNGGRPECLGVIGTPDRVNATVPTLLLDNERDRMYIVDTNHGADGMSLLAIDLQAFRPHLREKGPPCKDPFLTKDEPRYLAMSNRAMKDHRFTEENSTDFSPPGTRAVKIWRRCRPEDSAVIGLAWEDARTVCGLCGEGGRAAYAFRLSDRGEILSFEPVGELSAERAAWLREHMPPRPVGECVIKDLPWHSGRQYKAVPHAVAEWNGGRRIVGTLDGLLAIVRDDGIFALGPAAPNGPIHGLATNRAKTVCYGVAGDEEDLGMVFRYDDGRGLRQLGRIGCDRPGAYGVSASNRLSSVAMNDADDTLAIGSDDRLGVVYLVRVE